MPACTTYNPRNAHAAPIRTKTKTKTNVKGKGKGRRARGGVADTLDAFNTEENAQDEVKAKTDTIAKASVDVKPKVDSVVPKAIKVDSVNPKVIGNTNPKVNGNTNPKVISNTKVVDVTETAKKDEENVQPRGCATISVKTNGLGVGGGGPLSPLTNANNNSASVERGEKNDDHDLDDSDKISLGGVGGSVDSGKKSSDRSEAGEDIISRSVNGGGGEGRDKEGLAFEHARQRAKKASERAKRRARKAEMQAVAQAFVVSPVPTEENVEVEKKVKEEQVTTGHGLHKGSRVGKVGMRKAENGFNVDLDICAVDKRIRDRVRSMSGELSSDLDAFFTVDQGNSREVSLSELVYFAAQKKPKKNKEHDFEMIPALKTVIVLDDCSSMDMDVDEAWDHVSDMLSDQGELSYAQVVAGI